MSVYKITCPDNHFYIGSTKNSLEVRLYNHKIASRRHNTKFYSHINDWNEVKMELLEETTDYRNKEYEYIYNERNNPLCLNTLGVVDKEKQYLYNKEYDRQYSRRYYQKNKETILQKRKWKNQP